MRKLIVGVAVSLDGYIAGPNGEYDWCFTDSDYGLNEFYKRIDALLMGRKSYEVLLKEDDGSQGLSGMSIYVYSNTLEKVRKGAVLLKGDLQEGVERIRNDKGKDIWLFGGAMLTSALLNLHLVDEIWLSVHPILLGGGTALFQGLEHRISLKLIEEKTYASGLVSLWYHVQK